MGKELGSMSDFNNVFQKQEFIKKLEMLRDLEAEKPVEEMDVSLIKACVELILELRGETASLSTEEVEEKVRKIPFVEKTSTLNTTPDGVKGRATKVKPRKILLIAAIISILVAIFAISSVAFDWNIFEELKHRFGTVADTPVNEEIQMGEITVVFHGEPKTYSSIESALKNENINILFPGTLPEDVNLEEIIIQNFDAKERIVLVFDSTDFSYSVTLDEYLSEAENNVSKEILKINNIVCYVVDISDLGMTQIHFEYNGNLYKISYTDKQDLIEVIENLRSYNEN